MAGPLCLVYYCSGHGFGHATRVDAIASHLLQLDPKPTLYIVSSAPEHIFAGSIALGAIYRFAAEVDPVVVQPLAYSVDRQASVAVLRKFLERKDDKLAQETKWLRSVHAQCILSDAAFLGCLAANAIGLPSVLITNFTFDSVYSYLSTEFKAPDTLQVGLSDLVPDVPVLRSELEPLVKEIIAGYRCADLLLLLPGFIPIPSFTEYPALPAPDWIDPKTNILHSTLKEHLVKPANTWTLHPSIPFPDQTSRLDRLRTAVSAPLVVRPPSEDIYSQEGRTRLLNSIGIPTHMHNSKVLIVSFGGQKIVAPKSRSRTPSRRSSVVSTKDRDTFAASVIDRFKDIDIQTPVTPSSSLKSLAEEIDASPRLSSSSHIWIPGAPPALKRTLTASGSTPVFNMIPPTPLREKDESEVTFSVEEEEDVLLLPDETWVAVVCGVSKEQWDPDEGEHLPEGFYVAPKNVYMPDLTAAADCLLGKLGYGTVAECIDGQTPFVYVSRPLFVEEHGLRMLLEREGVGLEMSREAYEEGNWARTVEEAWQKGRQAKEKKRARGETGERFTAVRKMAEELVDWVHGRIEE